MEETKIETLRRQFREATARSEDPALSDNEMIAAHEAVRSLGQQITDYHKEVGDALVERAKLDQQNVLLEDFINPSVTDDLNALIDGLNPNEQIEE